jgi:hypothetical protein
MPLILALACAGAFAQANSDLTGIVTDQTGAVVAGATVVLTDPAVRKAYARNYALVRPDGHVAWRGDAIPTDVDSLLDVVTGPPA